MGQLHACMHACNLSHTEISGSVLIIWVHSRKSEIFTGERAGQFRVEGFALQHLRQWQWQAVVVINSGGGVSGCGSSM
eukprot:COSAG01_NODE_14755_length_1413_cov_36.140030_2_plen_77_part_01